MGVFEIVAVTVVEGEADEAPLVLLVQPSDRFIERDDVKPRLLHLVEHGIEEVGGNFENAIGCKLFMGLSLGAHLVQHENEPDALGVRGEKAVCPTMVKTRHRPLHHDGFYLGQGSPPLRTINH
jgi:hypothetical protein